MPHREQFIDPSIVNTGLRTDTTRRIAVYSGIAGGLYLHAGWTLAQGSGPREVSIPVEFPQPFREVPQVIIGNVSTDSEPGLGLRLNATVDELNTAGFTLTIRTWGDSRIHSAFYSWMAVGQ